MSRGGGLSVARSKLNNFECVGFQVEQVQRGGGAPYKRSGSMPGPSNGTPMCINFLDMEKKLSVIVKDRWECVSQK